MFNPICACTALLALAPYFFPTQGARLEYHNQPGPYSDDLDRAEIYLAGDMTPQKKRQESKVSATAGGGLWFGPRLGRRKRTESEFSSNALSPAEEEAVQRLLQDGPWAMITLKGGKRSVSFIPRLGRDSEESTLESFVEPSLIEYVGQAPISGQNPNFTPRMGRLSPPNNDHQNQQQQQQH